MKEDSLATTKLVEFVTDYAGHPKGAFGEPDEVLPIYEMFSVPLPTASPTSYAIGTGSLKNANQGNASGTAGLFVETAFSDTLNYTSFALNDQYSKQFALFNVWTNRTSINPAVDLTSRPISVTIDFTGAFGTNATVTGYTVGGTYGSGEVWGGQGILNWNAAVTVTAPNATQFKVTLNNVTFNRGGHLPDSTALLTPGPAAGATVYATVKQLSSTVSTVPDNNVTDGDSLTMAVSRLQAAKQRAIQFGPVLNPKTVVAGSHISLVMIDANKVRIDYV